MHKELQEQPNTSSALTRLPLKDVRRELRTDETQGLDANECQRRLAELGPNELPHDEGRSLWAIAREQFNDVLIYLLLVAALISVAVGETVDAIVIVVIVLLNAVIGLIQGRRAEAALAELRKLSEPDATVVRAGSTHTVPARELVPGDLVLLETGAGVPADLRLCESESLEVAEAVLTGESVPVEKRVQQHPPAEEVPVADQDWMCFRGTAVVAGRGTGIVVATGANSQLGLIAGLVADVERIRTPLQRRLARLSLWIAVAVVIVCLVVFTAGLLRGADPLEMFLTSVSLAVAAVPEALPAVVTIALALGAASMVRRAALVRRLPAVETLGSVTYICSDKTGTLTENSMSVVATWFPDGDWHPGHPDVAETAADDQRQRELRWAAALCNDATWTAEEQTGDPTETALLADAAAHGIPFGDNGRANGPGRVLEYPFNSDLMRMTTVHRIGGDLIVYVKGAPEVLVKDATALAQARQMAQDGLRVLAVARNRLPAGTDPLPDRTELERDLELIGLVGLLDPPRPSAAEAVAQCASAGITPVMITGDHPATAVAVGRMVGISGSTLTGAEVARMSDEALTEVAGQTAVYARTDPEQKIRIVRALQRRGEVAAMTGDGVNDAPALTQADIGVAMGQGGTDVARGASDLVLLDNNFATIVASVQEGRRIYDNIRRFVRYTLTSNSGEIWTIFLAPFLGLPLPLLPLQILWINLVTDGLPGLALAQEKAHPRTMDRPPRPPKQSIFAGGMGSQVIWLGLLIGALSLAAMAWAYFTGSPNWQSVVFTTLVFTQLANALALRSETTATWRLGFFSNRYLIWSILAMAALQLGVVYVPLLQGLFHTSAMTLAEVAVCLAAAVIVYLAVEIEKRIRLQFRS